MPRPDRVRRAERHTGVVPLELDTVPFRVEPEAEAVSTPDEFAEAFQTALADTQAPRVIVLNIHRSFVEPMTKGGAHINEFVEFK